MAQLFFEDSSEKRIHKSTNFCEHMIVISDEPNGEEICGQCGQVLAEKISSFLPSDSIKDSEDYCQSSSHGISNKLRIYDKGLRTKINPQNIDSTGRKIPSSLSQMFGRLRIWDNRAGGKTIERNLVYAFSLLDGMKDRLALPENVLERTAYLYRKAVQKKLTRGRSIPIILGASVYLACKEENVPRSINTISVALQISKKNLFQSLKIVESLLELKTLPHSAKEYLGYACNRLDLSQKIKNDARNILETISRKQLFIGKSPLVLCATAVWFSCIQNNMHITQKDLCSICGISEVSLRNSSKTFQIKLGMVCGRLILE